MELTFEPIQDSVCTHPDGSMTAKCIARGNPMNVLQKHLIPNADVIAALLKVRFDIADVMKRTEDFYQMLVFYNQNCETTVEVPCVQQEVNKSEVSDLPEYPIEDNIATPDDRPLDEVD